MTPKVKIRRWLSLGCLGNIFNCLPIIEMNGCMIVSIIQLKNDMYIYSINYLTKESYRSRLYYDTSCCVLCHC